MNPLPRRVNAYAWDRLVDRVFDLDVRDVDCAFTLIRRDLAQRLRLTADGAMISTEIVARAAPAGARTAEFGVHHRPRVAGRRSGAGATAEPMNRGRIQPGRMGIRGDGVVGSAAIPVRRAASPPALSPG